MTRPNLILVLIYFIVISVWSCNRDVVYKIPNGLEDKYLSVSGYWSNSDFAEVSISINQALFDQSLSSKPLDIDHLEVFILIGQTKHKLKRSSNSSRFLNTTLFMPFEKECVLLVVSDKDTMLSHSFVPPIDLQFYPEREDISQDKQVVTIRLGSENVNDFYLFEHNIDLKNAIHGYREFNLQQGRILNATFQPPSATYYYKLRYAYAPQTEIDYYEEFGQRMRDQQSNVFDIPYNQTYYSDNTTSGYFIPFVTFEDSILIQDYSPITLQISLTRDGEKLLNDTNLTYALRLINIDDSKFWIYNQPNDTNQQ